MLRDELLPPRVDRGSLTALVAEAFARLEAGATPADAAAALARQSGRLIAAEDLDGWAASMAPGEVAAHLLTPPRHELRRLRLSRDELVEVAHLLMASSDRYDGEHAEWWMALFDANVPDPGGCTLAYHPPAGMDAAAWDPAPEEVVDLALAYRPIEL